MGLTKGWLACFPSTAQTPQNDLSVLQKNEQRPKTGSVDVATARKVGNQHGRRYAVDGCDFIWPPLSKKLANESRIVCQAPSCVNSKMCHHKQCPHIRECAWRHVDKVRGIQGGWGGCRQAA